MICAVVPMQLLIYVAAEYVDWDRQENERKLRQKKEINRKINTSREI